MMKYATMFRFAAMSALFVLVMAKDAAAYFDPGAGSMLLQALAAGMIAVAMFWRRIKGMLVNMFGRKDKSNES